MKKIITILLVMLLILLILAMAVPAYAVTPTLDTPTITVPDISGSVNVEIPDKVFDDWFEEHPIDITTTEPPDEDSNDAATSFTVVFEFHHWLYQWWNNLIH